jgi:hypothetical protein
MSSELSPTHNVDGLLPSTPGPVEGSFTVQARAELLNSPFTPIPGNPDIPAIDGIPAPNATPGACIGLAEKEHEAGPPPAPRSIISSSP